MELVFEDEHENIIHPLPSGIIVISELYHTAVICLSNYYPGGSDHTHTHLYMCICVYSRSYDWITEIWGENASPWARARNERLKIEQSWILRHQLQYHSSRRQNHPIAATKASLERTNFTSFRSFSFYCLSSFYPTCVCVFLFLWRGWFVGDIKDAAYVNTEQSMFQDFVPIKYEDKCDIIWTTSYKNVNKNG